MHIPSGPAAAAASPATPTSPPAFHHGFFWLSKGTGSYPENWNSLIGIITAICGNILISFALNLQRYAHIRLDREWQERERQRKKRNASSTSLAKLGGQNGKNGKKRRYRASQQDANKNGHARRSGNAGYEASESDPLISDAHARSSLEREDSTDSGQEEACQQQSYLKSPYWWTGIILMTAGEAGNFLAYGFAPASIVSPLGVVALISNCIIAPFMLKEPFRKRDALGVIIAVGGAVTVVLSANDNNPKLGPEEIWDLIRRWEFETYLGITIAVIAGLMVCSNRFGGKTVLIDLGLVGLFGGYTALSTKGVASLLSYTLWRVITFPVFYLLVAILAGTAIMQIKYLNRALQRFDATQVIPVQFVLFTLSVIGGSAILYRDFERTSGQDAGKFVGGCALTFFGVWLITSGRPPRQNGEEEDREPEPEDAINMTGERYRDDIDDMNEEPVGNERRPSTSRTSSPPINIHSRYRDDPDSQPSSPTTRVKQDPSTRRLQGNSPSNSNDPNPQTTQTPNPEYPPPFSRHISTPVLPSEAASPRLSSISNPELVTNLPHTPTRGVSYGDLSSNPTLTSATAQSRLRQNSRQAERLSRPSLSGPLLTSPLSTTLSAMVQDIKRSGTVRQRDVEALARRRESLIGASAEGDEADFNAATPGEPLTRSRTHGENLIPTASADEFAGMVRGRGRSLSGTLGDLWRGLRGEGRPEDLLNVSASSTSGDGGSGGGELGGERNVGGGSGASS